MSSTPNSILQFKEYRFGEQIDIANGSIPSNSSVSPLASPRRHSLNNDSLSPLQSIISQQQDQNQYVQPLTRDILEKKDRLDMLLLNRFIPGVRTIQRRRSICNGNIYRHLYNEDNSPMTLAAPFTKMGSEISGASVNSPNSQYDVKFNHQSLPRNLKHHHTHHHYHHHGHHRHSASRDSSSIDKMNKRLNDSNQNCSYGSITNQNQSKYSRSVNTSHASSSSHPYSYTPKQHVISGPPRRFSGLVRLSAAHIALNRTRKNKKRHYQSKIYIFFHKLKIMASRVVNSRISEPADTKMSIEELTSLSKYLHFLKNGFNKDENNQSEDEDTKTPSNGAQSPMTPKHPIIDLYVEEEARSSNREQEVSMETTNVNHEEESSPLLTSSSKNKKKRNLSSLGNIFPFAPIDSIPSISRSGSENSQINRLGAPTESDRLLPPKFHSGTSPRSQKNYYLDKISIKISKFIKHICRPIAHFQQYRHLEEQNTHIRFEGWSLFCFSPTSLTRLYLWKIVGSGLAIAIE